MFTLPKLPYSYNALEPYIDAKTMELHYTKHHQGYVDKLNASLEKYPEYYQKSIEELLSSVDLLPKEIITPVINFGGGHFNHTFFWQILSPKKQKIPNDFLNLKEEFEQKSLSFFGSGWTWIVKNKNNGLEVVNTPNQESPISQGLKPVLALDLWEHAYYLLYQNKKAEYIEAFWNVVNWEQIQKLAS